MGTETAIAGLILSAVGTAATISGQRKDAKAAQRRADEANAADRRREALEKRRQDIIASRKKITAAAEARRKIAIGANLAESQGAGGAIGAPGSTVPAITGNITSQLNANNSFINTVTSVTNEAAAAGGEATRIASTPIRPSGLSAFGAVASSAGAFAFNNSDKISSFIS